MKIEANCRCFYVDGVCHFRYIYDPRVTDEARIIKQLYMDREFKELKEAFGWEIAEYKFSPDKREVHLYTKNSLTEY